MTYYKCPECAGEKDTPNDVIMVICPCCQIAMEKISYPHKRIVEVEE